jgi:hypothetical protein
MLAYNGPACMCSEGGFVQTCLQTKESLNCASKITKMNDIAYTRLLESVRQLLSCLFCGLTFL